MAPGPTHELGFGHLFIHKKLLNLQRKVNGDEFLFLQNLLYSQSMSFNISECKSDQSHIIFSINMGDNSSHAFGSNGELIGEPLNTIFKFDAPYDLLQTFLIQGWKWRNTLPEGVTPTCIYLFVSLIFIVRVCIKNYMWCSASTGMHG